MKKAFNSILICLLFTFSLHACADRKKAEPEIYLIPAGYEGSFFVVFDVSTGKKPKHEGKSRVYQIPVSGILETQLPFNKGWLASTDIKYFFLNNNGSRTPITKRWLGSVPNTPENRADPNIYIFSGGVGTLGLGMSNSTNRCSISFSYYIVATKSRVLNSLNKIKLTDYYVKPPYPCSKKPSISN